jgi:hypothetical protein
MATLLATAIISPVYADVSPTSHGLPPANDMTFLPHLTGLRNKTFHNHYGQKKQLSEAIVVRNSDIAESRATIPPGGLFYLSETSGDAKPFMRDPFLVLGEHTYLVDLSSRTRTIKNLHVKQGHKALVGDTGYRMWFDYATDHYDKPYAELALISPSGGWPLEFPISTEFKKRNECRELTMDEGYVEQLKPFFMDREYVYGNSRFLAEKIDSNNAVFESVIFPEITQATFSMHRPIVMEVRQEDYRLYFNKRIYAHRQPDGFLVKVTDFSGTKVYAEKLIKPITAQGYKTVESEKNNYQLTIPELDMRVEIMIRPSFLKHSDMVPWSTGKAHGFQNGELSFVIYRRLLTVENGGPWPLDPRYNVILEPDIKTGMLKRLMIENNDPIVFDHKTKTYKGPVKYSNIWNRPAFKLVVKKIENDVVRDMYIRDYLGMRTDNMVFWPKDGRYNLDCFLGSSPVLEPILEDTFLKRLATPSFGTVVEKSSFISYPKVISDSSFYEPDHTAPFVPRLKGLKRKFMKNRKKERMISAESVFIRGSHVDWRNGQIIIPPAGLCYSSRNSRNIRTLAGESFFILGKKAYLTSFKSSTFVKKNFDLDFWKNQPMGDGNLMYWQDELLGIRNKALRFTDAFYLDDRPVSQLSLMKYSGNRWGAHFFMAQGLDRHSGNRYAMPEVFAEGSTYIIPEYVGSNYVKIKEFGTQSIESICTTYKKPQKTLMGAGDTVELGKFQLVCTAVDIVKKTISLELKNSTGKIVAFKQLGPLSGELRDLLPQHQEAARAMQFMHDDVQAEMDIKTPFKANKAQLYLFTDIQTLKRDTAFEFDPRFVLRPDVCGHCYQLNELLLDNSEPIILDREHPVYDGPINEAGTPLFSIVIDDFDGEMIHAWHMETEKKGKVTKTDNLAFRPRNNVDVIIGVNGTSEGFLRLSMLPRLGFMEYWRTSSQGPDTRISGSVNTGGSAHIRR